MSTKSSSLRLYGGLVAAGLFSAVRLLAQPTGQWDFNAGNLNATVGSALNYADGTTAGLTAFGTTTSFSIPDIAGSPANVMRFPAATNGQGFLMPTPTSANGGGSIVNKYTLILDVLYPTASATKNRPLVQTEDGSHLGSQQFIIVESAASGVGPYKIGPSGVNGPFVGGLAANTWYRLGIVVDAGNIIRVYTNGVEMGNFTANTLDGFFALQPSASALILADSSTNAALGYVNSIQLRDVALNAGQMAALGSASAAGIPTVIPPVPSFVASRTPSVGQTGVNEEPTITTVVDQGDTTITSGSVKLFLDGALVSTAVDTPPVFTNSYVVPPRLDPLSTHTLKLTWNDSVVGNKTSSWTFVVKDYQVVTLPPPFYFEDFDALTENATPGVALPAGWTVQDQTAPGNAGNNLDDRNSDSYKGWILVNSSRLAGWGTERTDLPTIVVNGTKLTSLTSGNLMWAESDSRCGGCYGQFADMFPAPISCTGRTNVYLAFYSVYEQNNDNMNFIEYSVDGGVTWNPALYMFQYPPDGQQPVPQIIYTNGVIDVGATFSQIAPSRNWAPDPSPNPVYSTNYGSYIKAPINVNQIPFIKGYINDSTTDGKRVELIRLAKADGQASVRFRINANGTSSWFWGIDNFGLYEINTPVFSVNPANRTIAAGTGTNLTVTVSSPTALTYQWQHEGTNISNGGHFSGVTTATLTIANAGPEDAGSYRCKASNSSGTTTSTPGTLTVVTVPTVTTQPNPVVLSDGYPLSLSGVGFGGLPLTYEWRRNGTAVGSGTAYNLASAHSANAGDYTLVITNSYGAVTSRVARVTVINVPITNGLVAYYKFDSDYNDYSGHGNNGTPVNGPSLTTGKIGNALNFTTSRGTVPDVTNYVTLNYPTDLKFADNTSFTISMWVNMTNQSDDLALIGNTQWDSSNNRGWGIFSQGGGNFRIKSTSGAGGAVNRTDVTYANVIRDGTWHHLLVTFDQGAAIFTTLDGVALSPRIWTATTVGSVDTDDISYVRNISGTDYTGTHAINIGQEGTGWYNDKNGGAITNGLIDDVGFWRRAVSPQEALAIYQAGLAGQNLLQVSQVASAGVLTASRAGANINFSWSAATGVRLQRSATASPTSWNDVAGTTGLGSYSEPTTNAASFYRLYKP